jgi:transcriptional regulator with GAF, ATPase, and Fis domain
LLRILALQIGPLLAQSSEDSAAQPPVAERPVESNGGIDDVELARSICDAVTTEIDPDRLIEIALAAVANVVQADLTSLYLLSGNGQELLREGQCDRAGLEDRPRLPIHQGLTGIVFQTGHLVATDAPDGDSRFAPEVDTPASGTVGPLICVPIRVRAKTLGVLRVFPVDGAHASARTGEVLTAAMSAAVRNVLLYRSLLESIDEVARARRESRPQG